MRVMVGIVAGILITVAVFIIFPNLFYMMIAYFRIAYESIIQWFASLNVSDIKNF